MAEQINFFDIDAGGIYDMIISFLEREVGEPLYPGDERRNFGEAVAALAVAIINKCNDDARQSLLRFARGSVLDALGERVNTPRLIPEQAKTILRFSIQQPLSQNIIIPAGTRATPDAALYFATIAAAVLLQGNTYIDVEASSTEGGSIYNSYKPGTINTLVDLIPFIESVYNVDESHGGDDGELTTDEGDDNYRKRIQLAPSRFSTAGPEAAYRYFALSADPNIKEVKIISDQAAGTVSIIVLMKNGEGPDADVIADIMDIVNDEKTRPLTDLVLVESPSFHNYDINIKYYVTDATEAAAIQTIEGGGGSIDRFVEWQGAAISKDINPDRLRAFILAPNWASDQTLTGALRVDVISPTFTQLGQRDVARFSGIISVTHEVVEE